jgi:hypothetical protein
LATKPGKQVTSVSTPVCSSHMTSPTRFSHESLDASTAPPSLLQRCCPLTSNDRPCNEKQVRANKLPINIQGLVVSSFLREPLSRCVVAAPPQSSTPITPPAATLPFAEGPPISDICNLNGCLETPSNDVSVSPLLPTLFRPPLRLAFQRVSK